MGQECDRKCYCETKLIHDVAVSVAINEVRLADAEKALDLARNNWHIIVAEIVSVIALLVATFRGH